MLAVPQPVYWGHSKSGPKEMTRQDPRLSHLVSQPPCPGINGNGQASFVPLNPCNQWKIKCSRQGDLFHPFTAFPQDGSLGLRRPNYVSTDKPLGTSVSSSVDWA